MDCERRDHELLIRPLVTADVRPLYQAVRGSVASLSYWLPWCRPDYSLADAEAWVAHSQDAWTRQNGFAFGVFDGHTGELLGGSGLSQVNGLNRSANLGYWIGEPQRGRGIGTRAAALTAAIGFDELDLIRLEIVVLPQNTASLRVAQKLGAMREAAARNRLMFQGRPSSAIVYSLIPGDLSMPATPDSNRP